MSYFLVLLTIGVLSSFLAREKDIDAFIGFLFGLFLGPLGFLIVLVLPKNTHVIEQRQLISGEMQKCPSCAELVKIDAIKCRYCHAELEQTQPKPITTWYLDKFSEKP